MPPIIPVVTEQLHYRDSAMMARFIKPDVIAMANTAATTIVHNVYVC